MSAKEHPILFSGPMVQALLANRKTVTRRLSKRWLKVKAGDLLWVRETTERYYLPDILTGEPTDADAGRYCVDKEPVLTEDGFDLAWWYKRPTCPSIHMPRWASRITLRATEDARVERLQDLTAGEARAEGIEEYKSSGLYRNYAVSGQGYPSLVNPQHSLETLWNSLHTKSGERWEDNPEVVRLRLEKCNRVQPQGDLND